MVHSRNARLVLFTLIGFAASAPRTARADFHLGIEALTDFPLDIGAKVWMEIPLRLRFGASIGVMPGFYVGTVNSIAQSAGAYDDSTATLLTASLTNSLVTRGFVGWRPFSERGFYFSVGYGYIALGGGQSTGAAVSAVSGSPLPPSTPMNATYQVGGKLHMLDAELGWWWDTASGVTLRAAIGFAFTISSAQDVKPGFTPMGDADTMAQKSFTQSAQQNLDAHSKLLTPTATLAVGYELF